MSLLAESTSGMTHRACAAAILRMAGLRQTRQRVILAELLFSSAHRHVSAEELYQDALEADADLSLSTVYNTLKQFRQAGLLREIAIDSVCSYFDTDTSDHHHFFLEEKKQVIDIPAGAIAIDRLPSAPQGMTVTHVDDVVHVREQHA